MVSSSLELIFVETSRHTKVKFDLCHCRCYIALSSCFKAQSRFRRFPSFTDRHLKFEMAVSQTNLANLGTNSETDYAD